jgi:hypothetical protein
MQQHPDPTDVAMERLRSRIALARARLAEADRDLAERWQVMLACETPAADHAYRLARDERAQVRGALEDLEASLGWLVLEREGGTLSGTIPA